MDFRIISIGTLAANPIWNERAPARTGHATTTLITSGKVRLLVDPGLPEQALVARLSERANLTPADITHVFLTSLHPETHRAITAFDAATWWISSDEREVVGSMLANSLKRMLEGPHDATLRRAIENDIAVLRKCQPAPDHLADRIDLFPLHGVTPGLCGLILSGERHTTVICGDAVPTQDHLEQGKVLQTAADVDKARTSLEEAIEVADLLVLGRDNIVVNPTKRAF